MHHTIEIDENNVAIATIVGDGDTEIAEQFVLDANAVFAEYPEKEFDALVDMTRSGLSNYGGIQVYQRFLKSAPLRRIAFVVVNEVVEAFVKLAIEKTGREVKFFKTKEEAYDWLVH